MDFGLKVVEEVFRLLPVDADWAVRFDRGFTWWIGEVAQTIWVEEPVCSEDSGSWARVFARTDVLRNFDSSEDQAWGLANWQGAAMSGFARRSDDLTRVGLVSSAFVNEGDEDRFAREFAITATLQASDAYSYITESFKPSEGGPEIDRTAHPLLGPRLDWHRVVDGYEDEERATWEQRRLWGMMPAIPEAKEDFITVFSEAGEFRSVFEYPFGGKTCTVVFDVQQLYKKYFFGVWARLALPLPEMNYMDGLRLMEAELQEPNHIDVLGGWMLEPSGGMAFRANISSSHCHEPIIAVTTALQYQRRANFAARLLCNDDWLDGGFEKSLVWRYRPGDDPVIAANYYGDLPGDAHLTSDLAAFKYQAGMFEIPYDVLKGAVIFSTLQLLIQGKEEEVMGRLSQGYLDKPPLRELGLNWDGLNDVLRSLLNENWMDDSDFRRWTLILGSAPIGNLLNSTALCQKIFGRAGRCVAHLEDAVHVAWHLFKNNTETQDERRLFASAVDKIHRITPSHLNWMYKTLNEGASVETDNFTPVRHLFFSEARTSGFDVEAVATEIYENICQRNARYMPEGALWYESPSRSRYAVVETLLFLAKRQIKNGVLKSGPQATEEEIQSLTDTVIELIYEATWLHLPDDLPGLSHGEIATRNSLFMYSAMTHVVRPITASEEEEEEAPRPRLEMPSSLIIEREEAAHFYDGVAPNAALTEGLTLFQEEGGMLQVPYEELKGVFFVESIRKVLDFGLEESKRLFSTRPPGLPRETELTFNRDAIYQTLVGEAGSGQQIAVEMERPSRLSGEVKELCRLACRQLGSAIPGSLEEVWEVALLVSREESTGESIRSTAYAVSWHLPPHLAWLRSSFHFTPEAVRAGRIPMQKLLGLFILLDEQPELFKLANHLCHVIFNSLMESWGEGMFWYDDPPRLRREMVQIIGRSMDDFDRIAVKRELPPDVAPPSGGTGQTISQAVEALEGFALFNWGVDITGDHRGLSRGEIVERDTYFFYSAFLSAVIAPDWLAPVGVETPPLEPAGSRIRVSEAPASRLQNTVPRPEPEPEPKKKGFFSRWKKS